MQNNNKTWFVIINPFSGGKKGLHLWGKIRDLSDAQNIDYVFEVTKHEGHAIEITATAIKNGYMCFLIIGGDGTANEVINGIFNNAKDTHAITVAMVSTGTGNDWVRTTGKFTSLKKIPGALMRKETFLHDAGIIKYSKNNEIKTRWFINIAGLGFDGMVAKKLAGGSGFFTGTKLRYYATILRLMFSYKKTKISLVADGNKSTHTVFSIACGICRFNGGGLMQLPNAKADDGILDMTIIKEMSGLKMLASLPKLSDGSFLTMKEIKAYTGKSFTINSEPPVYVEADGEFLGETPAMITIIQQAIQVLKWD